MFTQRVILLSSSSPHRTSRGEPVEVAPPLGVVAVLLCEVGGLFGGLQPYLFYHGDSISPFLCHCLSSSLGLLDLPHMILSRFHVVLNPCATS